jgi:hypothetical protein
MRREGYFAIKELIYPELYEKYRKLGMENLLWRCLDMDVVESANRIREFVNSPITVNNGSRFTLSGLRPFNTRVGAKLSQHKFGRALDLKFRGNYTPESLRRYMRDIGCFEPGFLKRTDHEAYPFLLIKRIEWIPHMGWFHMDTYGKPNQSKIIIVRG